MAINVALTLRAVFRLALRRTEGLIGSILVLLGLDLAVPDHTTLSRRAESLEVVCPRSGYSPVHPRRLVLRLRRPQAVGRVLRLRAAQQRVCDQDCVRLALLARRCRDS